MKLKALTLLCFALAGCTAGFSTSFKNMEEVRESGLMEKGWIPPELPDDAVDIHVRWDVDTNLSEGTYQSRTLVRPGSDCRPWPSEAGALRCGSYHFRTENGRQTFSNSGLT